jgi:crotonobetainyl-CoA:carnitine CoA-transferase CaiB-like acyl-CoA transferase
VKHLGILKKVVSPHFGEQALMGQPVTLSRTPSTIARATPRRGEHSEEILAEIGFSAEERARMKTAGVY